MYSNYVFIYYFVKLGVDTVHFTLEASSAGCRLETLTKTYSRFVV